MAVNYLGSFIRLEHAKTALSAFATIDSLLSARCWQTVSTVVEQEQFRDLLVQARLDPTDSEAWGEIAEPTTEDRESAAASRAVTLLVSSTVKTASYPVVPYYVRALLSSAGWSDGDIEVCIGGRQLAKVLVQADLVKQGVADDIAPWLPGGGLFRNESELWAERLDQVNSSDIESVAFELSRQTSLPRETVVELTQSGLAGLRNLHSEALSTPEKSLTWVVID